MSSEAAYTSSPISLNLNNKSLSWWVTHTHSVTDKEIIDEWTTVYLKHYILMMCVYGGNVWKVIEVNT